MRIIFFWFQLHKKMSQHFHNTHNSCGYVYINIYFILTYDTSQLL